MYISFLKEKWGKSYVIFHRRELLFKTFCNAVNEYSPMARAASASHCLSHKKDMSYKAVLPCPSLIRIVLFINIALQRNFLFEMIPFTMSLIMRLYNLFSWSVAVELPTGEIKKIPRLSLEKCWQVIRFLSKSRRTWVVSRNWTIHNTFYNYTNSKRTCFWKLQAYTNRHTPSKSQKVL